MLPKINAEVKLAAVTDFLNGNKTLRQIGDSLGVTHSSVRKWVMNYKAMGEAAFSHPGCRYYSKEFKEEAVHAYLAGEGSLMDICEKFKIPSTAPLLDWIKKYNSHEELKATGTLGGSAMTKGRKTTFEERIEIVTYCIEHDRDYYKTAKEYKISYQQARNYTVKYEENGIDALQDRRGKSKPQDQLTENDKLRAELKIAQAARKRAEMELALLKKMKETERRRL